MTFAFISGTKAGGNGGVSPAINTIGATIIIVGLAQDFNTVETFNDNQGNTYTGIQRYNTAFCYSSIFYCVNPTTSAAHTFTASGAATNSSICVAAFSGVRISSPQEGNTGANNTSSSTIQPGSQTPSQNYELIITTCSISTLASTLSIDSGFTISDQIAGSGGAYYGSGLAYIIQTTSGAVNPTWTLSGSVPPGLSVAMASFKAAGAVPFSQGRVFG